MQILPPDTPILPNEEGTGHVRIRRRPPYRAAMRWLSSTRLRLWWWQAFWVLPFVGLLVGYGLQSLIGALDEAAYGSPLETQFSTSAATSLLAAIGGGMITFTGFVFSFIVLILQFGSTAYSPRTVSYFLRARSTQVILAIFVMTITYCFLAMIDVGSGGRSDFTPTLTVWVALWMLVASLIGFIALLQITGSRVRVDRVLTDLRRVATDRLPDRFPSVHRSDIVVQRPPPSAPESLVPIHYRGRSGQLVAVESRRFLRLAAASGGYFRMTVRVGDGLLPGDTIAVVSPDARIDPRTLSSCLVVSVERSLRHDPLYALRLLVDIAIKALSPAINDPTTAVRSIDEIEGVLRRAATMPLGPVGFSDADTTVVLEPPSWDDFLDLALLEIITVGAGQPQISRRLTALFNDLQVELSPDRRPAVDRFRLLLDQAVGRRVDDSQRPHATVADRQGIGGSHAPPPAPSGRLEP